MGRFCAGCGAPAKETDSFCGKCGLDLRTQPVMTVPSAPAAPAVQLRRRSHAHEKLPRKIANTVMRYAHLILIGLLIFTLILGIMNFAAKHSVSVRAVAKFDGEVQRERQRMVLSDLYEAKEYAGLALCGFAYGLFNCILSAYAGFVVFLRMRSPKGLKRQIRNYSLTAIAGNALYLILVWIFGVQSQKLGAVTLKAIVSPHFTVWLSIVLFGLLLACALLSRTRRRRR